MITPNEKAEARKECAYIKNQLTTNQLKELTRKQEKQLRKLDDDRMTELPLYNIGDLIHMLQKKSRNLSIIKDVKFGAYYSVCVKDLSYIQEVNLIDALWKLVLELLDTPSIPNQYAINKLTGCVYKTQFGIDTTEDT